MLCLDKEISTVSLCLIIQSLSAHNARHWYSPLPITLQIFLGEAGLRVVQSLARCLFRWATADEGIVWSAVPASADHPAAAAMMTHRPKQEVGNRKKKEGPASCPSWHHNNNRDIGTSVYALESVVNQVLTNTFLPFKYATIYVYVCLSFSDPNELLICLY